MKAKIPGTDKLQAKVLSRTFSFRKICSTVTSMLSGDFRHSGISIKVDEECGSIDLIRPVSAYRNKVISLQLAPDGSILILSEGECDQVMELSRKVAAEVLSRFHQTEIN